MNNKSTKIQAKKIMDKFMNAMSDISIEEEFILKRNECFREDEQGIKTDEDFRQRFLSNAKKTSGNAILTNRGDWEK